MQPQEDSNFSQLPALPGDMVELKLNKIEKQLSVIVEKQSNNVSPEFNALMDGYVNKANESQEYRVKYEHLETIYEELNLNFKSLQDELKKLKIEYEALKEALRMSELDLQRMSKDIDTDKQRYEQLLTELKEDRDALKERLRQMMEENDKLSREFAENKSELLESRYKFKQLEQERLIDIETQKRSMKESNKVVEELREKLDLRTREVEYKDALLNQLIKQVSSGGDPYAMKEEDSPSGFNEPVLQVRKDFQRIEAPNKATKQEPNLNPPRKIKSNLKLDLDDDSSPGSSWGAFRK